MRFRDADFAAPVLCDGHPIIKHCVLVASDEQGVAVRDSKDPTNVTLYFSHDEWDALIESEIENRRERPLPQ